MLSTSTTKMMVPTLSSSQPRHQPHHRRPAHAQRDQVEAPAQHHRDYGADAAGNNDQPSWMSSQTELNSSPKVFQGVGNAGGQLPEIIHATLLARYRARASWKSFANHINIKFGRMPGIRGADKQEVMHMQDRGLTDDQRMMRQSCRDFVDDVVIPFVKANWKQEWSMTPEARLPDSILEGAEKVGIRTLQRYPQPHASLHERQNQDSGRYGAGTQAATTAAELKHGQFHKGRHPADNQSMEQCAQRIKIEHRQRNRA